MTDPLTLAARALHDASPWKPEGQDRSTAWEDMPEGYRLACINMAGAAVAAHALDMRRASVIDSGTYLSVLSSLARLPKREADANA